MKYYYEAHDKFGSPTVGEIEADSDEMAAQVLREKGLFAREISTEPIDKPKYSRGVLTPMGSLAEDQAPDEPIDEEGETLDMEKIAEQLGATRKPMPEAAEKAMAAAGLKKPAKKLVDMRDADDIVSARLQPPACDYPEAWQGWLANRMAKVDKILAQLDKWEQGGEGAPPVSRMTWDIYLAARRTIAVELLIRATDWVSSNNNWDG